MKRTLTTILVLLAALIADAPASVPTEPPIQMNFVNTPLVELLRLYEVLTQRHVHVGDELRNRPVSICSKGEIPRSAAIKLIESQLANDDIKIVERDGVLLVVGPKDGEETVYRPVRSPKFYESTRGLSGEALN
jgi:hypothetical protein